MKAAGATAFTDASGNAHTTDCTGDACPTVGVSGMFTTALRFDGVNDYLESDDFDLDDDFSISLWVNPSTTDDYQVFIGKHNSDGDNLMLFGFYNGGYYFRIRDTIYQGGTKTTGWQHLAVTGRYSDTSETAVTMFKNGQVLWQQTLNAVVGDISGGKGWSLGQDWDTPRVRRTSTAAIWMK